MDAIGPGDFVECIRLNSSAPASVGVHIGGVYLVDDVRTMKTQCHACEKCASVGLRLAGIRMKPPGYTADYICAGAFRPIYKSKSALIERLMTKDTVSA